MASLAHRTRKYFITVCFLTLLVLLCISWYLYNSETVPSDHIKKPFKLTAQSLELNAMRPRNRMILSGSSLVKDGEGRNISQGSYRGKSEDFESLESFQVGKAFHQGQNLPVSQNTNSDSRLGETETAYRNPLIPNSYGQHDEDHQPKTDSGNVDTLYRNRGGPDHARVFDAVEHGFQASQDQDLNAELPGKEGLERLQASASGSNGHKQNEMKNLGLRVNLHRLSHLDVNKENRVNDSRTQSEKWWMQDSKSNFPIKHKKQFKEALNSRTFNGVEQLENARQNLSPNISSVSRTDFRHLHPSTNISSPEPHKSELVGQQDQTKSGKQSDNNDKIDWPSQAESNNGYEQMPEQWEDGNKRPLSEQPLVSSDTKEEEEHVQRTTARPDSCQSCFHNSFPVLIDHPGFCHHMSTTPTVLLLISTAPDNELKRNAIRNTWGSGCQEDGSPYRCMFVLGRAKTAAQNEQIEVENKKHNDILQFGFMDAYSNLTYKTIMSLLWSEAECPDIPFVMKTDDDMYINTELIPKMLTAAPQTSFVGGFCWGNSSPSRDASSKWYVPFQTYTRSQFPPMCSGTGYIMSRDVVTNVLKASENIPFFHLEDVYIALCFKKHGVRPVRIQGFNNLYVQFNACEYRRSVMTSHQVPPDLLTGKWGEIQECSASTAKPTDLFREISYPITNK